MNAINWNNIDPLDTADWLDETEPGYDPDRDDCGKTMQYEEEDNEEDED